ncbi:hypothetical protein SH1V18_10950 [Vallitalea longa]|uniref:TNT domain-containing protein n=1 Tax=Vallitalea longa TaxID=2936439 RepID=A0A9W5Y7T7_9FIRM|nr:TNT domain-containing protein [Vallitalea longa]GKX28615.1 hypothetical protein SH1V18_10950 [Vallitalea longa]
MGNISIRTGELHNDQYQLKRCLDRITEIEDSFRNIKYSLDRDIKYRNGIDSKMTNIENKLGEISNDLYRLSDFLKNTKDDYEYAEKEIECLACSLNNVTQPKITEKSNQHDNPFLKGVRFLSKIGLFGIIGGLFTTIENLSKFFSNKKVVNNTVKHTDLSYNKSRYKYDEDVDFKVFNGLILEEGIYQGKIKDDIKGKDIVDLKKSLENVLKNYEGYKVDLKDENGNYNCDIDGNLDEAVYKFLYGYREYHPGNYLRFTYDALPGEYKLKTLLHWVDMAENDYSTLEFVVNLLPKEYFENIPPLPLQDNEIGMITNENKYESSDAYEYYIKYYFPLDALNEVNYLNDLEQVKRTSFNSWARLTYGSSKAEQKEEFGVGLLFGLSIAPLKTVYDTVEGIYSFIQDPAQVKVFAEFMGKAVVNSEYREALWTMITQAIEQWKISYDEAEPYEKGIIIGSLIGEALLSALEGGKSAVDIVKFVKNGGFKKAIKGVIETTKKINKIISAKLDDLPDLIRDITRIKNCYEVVTPEGIIYKIDIDDLPDEKIKLLDEMIDGGVDSIKKVDRLRIDKWDYTPTDELYLKYKKVYDDPLFYDQATGKIHWPVDDGFKAGTKGDSIIKEGKVFKRYGENTGEFLGSATDSFESRALAPHSENASIHYYQLTEDYKMTSGKAAPWFGSDGGADQFVKYKPDGTKYTIKELEDAGILEDITDLVERGEILID